MKHSTVSAIGNPQNFGCQNVYRCKDMTIEEKSIGIQTDLGRSFFIPLP